MRIISPVYLSIATRYSSLVETILYVKFIEAIDVSFNIFGVNIDKLFQFLLALLLAQYGSLTVKSDCEKYIPIKNIVIKILN